VSKLSFTTTRFDSDPDNGSLTLQKKAAAAGVAGLTLLEIAAMLVYFNHAAGSIVYADHCIM